MIQSVYRGINRRLGLPITVGADLLGSLRVVTTLTGNRMLGSRCPRGR